MPRTRNTTFVWGGIYECVGSAAFSPGYLDVSLCIRTIPILDRNAKAVIDGRIIAIRALCVVRSYGLTLLHVRKCILSCMHSLAQFCRCSSDSYQLAERSNIKQPGTTVMRFGLNTFLNERSFHSQPRTAKHPRVGILII